LFQRRNVLQFDETPVLKAGLKDISHNKVDDFLHRLGQTPLEREDENALIQELNNLSIMIDIGSSPKPTLGGLLAFGKNPQRFFPAYTILCGAYRGCDADSQVVSERNLTGTLDSILKDAMSFLRLIIPQAGGLIDGIRRSDSFLYPIEALREGIVNAVCHRDYTITGSFVRVFVFSDRIEIRSPGGLPNTLTLQSMAYRQFARNQVIASFLSGFGFMERRGKGILRIKKICGEKGVNVRFELTPDQNELGAALLRRPLLTASGSLYCFILANLPYLITFR